MEKYYKDIMKKIFNEVKIKIVLFKEEDMIRTSGEVEGDETKYPIPDGWAE